MVSSSISVSLGILDSRLPCIVSVDDTDVSEVSIREIGEAIFP